MEREEKTTGRVRDSEGIPRKKKTGSWDVVAQGQKTMELSDFLKNKGGKGEKAKPERVAFLPSSLAPRY